MTGLQILLIEDNYLNRRLARDVLERRKHVIVEATTVGEARARLGEGQPLPDVVLLDIGIPGGGGEAVLREIRANPRLKRLPVIAVTAYAMVGDKEQLLKNGFDGYLSKPINTRTFAAEVESIVGEKT